MALSQENRKSYSKLAQLYNCYQNSFPIYELVSRVLQKDGDVNFKIPLTSPIGLTVPELSGGTALHIAVLRNDSHTFEKLMMNGADITIQNQQGRTALHCLLDLGDDPVKNDMLDYALMTHVSLGDPSNPCDNDGISHLHIACKKDQASVVEFFLDFGSPINAVVNPDAKKYAGYTPLHFAAEGCAFSIINILVHREASIDIKDARGLTPFHLLLKEKITRIDILMNAQADNSLLIASFDAALNSLLSGPEAIDDLGLMHFHVACAMQDTSVAEFYLSQPNILDFIDMQVKMDSPLFPGYTALHFAAHCNLNIAKFLLMKRANFEVRDANGVTPMDLFWQKPKREELQMILDQSWKYAKFNQGPLVIDFINSMWDDNTLRDYLNRPDDLRLKMGDQPSCWMERTLLHFAVLVCKNIQTMKIFMEAEYAHHLYPQINAQDFYGSTPIHLAFRANKLDIVDLLMRHQGDASKNLVDKDGLSYLHIACAIKKPLYVEQYCQYAENLASICRGTYSHPWVKPGSSALHVAVASGDPRTIKTLLKNGLNPLVKDAKGQTPFDRCLHLTQPAEGVCQAFLESDKLTNEVLEYIGLTRLHLAVYSNVPEIEKYANKDSLRFSITCNDPTSFLYDYDGYTPLHMALKRHATVEHARLLLRKPPDLLVMTARGECPLYTALLKYIRDDKLEYTDILEWIIDKLQYDADLRKQLEEMSGMTILHLVCYAVDVNAISWLMIGDVKVKARINSDCPVWPGCTPLHVLMKAIKFHGVTRDMFKAARMLIDKGADVSDLNEDGETPIHLALPHFKDEYSFRLLTLLVDKLRVIDINPCGTNGMSHFHAACLINHATKVKEFLASGVDPNETIDFFAEHFPGHTPLHLALETKSSDNFIIDNEEEVVDWLLINQADVTAEDRVGQTPFVKAISTQRDFSYWEKFVGTASSTIDTPDIYMQRPLEILLRKTIIRPQEMIFFANRGCLLNDYNPVTDAGYVGIMISDIHNSFDLRILDDHKQCFNMMVNQTQSNWIHNIVTTPSHCSTIFNFYDLHKNFKSLDFDVDSRERKGKTALHLAAKFGNEIAVKELLKGGADVNIVDFENKTALDYAIEYQEKDGYCPNKICHKRVIQYLVDHVRMLDKLGLVVSDKNTQARLKLFETMSNPDKFSWDYEYNKKLKNFKEKVMVEPIFDTGLFIKDFLSESGKGLIGYPFMTDLLREKIDSFFQNYHHQLKDICMLQYRRTFNRMKMIKKAIDTIWAMVKTPVPVVCIEMIFQYLTNTDLQNFLEGTDSIIEIMIID